MKVRHIFRKSKRTPEEIARLRADRERYQRDKPTIEQLMAEGGHEKTITLGEYLALYEVAARLRRERQEQNLTLAEIENRTGIDQGALSRLETGKQANTTLGTLFRIADALGKELVCSLRDASPVASASRSTTRRRAAR